MINFCCVYYGDKYKPEYVQKLYNMVQRHLTVPHKFYCFTDHHGFGVAQHIKFAELTEKIIFKPFPRTDMEGWWNKLQLFHPETGLQGVNLYMDLDVVILKNIDCFATHGDDTTFGITNDFGQPTTIYNSSIIKWNNINASSLIWDKYFTDRITWRKVQGDQNVVTDLMKKNPLLIPFPDEWTFSYKWFSRTQPRFPKNQWTFELEQQAKVAVFHGNPNPHESEQQWVKDNWK